MEWLSTYEVATACALAIEADKLISIVDGQIVDEHGRFIRFMTLRDADLLIRKRAKQSETAANYVKFVGEDINSSGYLHSNISGTISWKEKEFIQSHRATFQNGVGFDNGNGWSGEQGFAIGGEERLSRLNGYHSELAAAAFVCKVLQLFNSWEPQNFIVFLVNFFTSNLLSCFLGSVLSRNSESPKVYSQGTQYFS